MRAPGELPGHVRILLAAAGALVALASTPHAATAATPPATVTLSFAGDTILGSTPQLPAKPDSYLAPITKKLSSGADVVFANLEGTLTNGGPSKCPHGSGGSCFAFRNPPSYARVLGRAGVDVLGLANNHSYDYGAEGLRQTKKAVLAAHLRYTGLPGQITFVTVRKTRIAFVAFAPYAGRTNNLLDLRAAAQLIRKAHAQAPVTVVYMHAGAEGASAAHVTGREEHYAGEDRGNPERFAHMAVDSGANLVVASGPHVLRGMEFYRKRLIAYSLGNFVNFHNFSSSGVLSRSMILRVTLTTAGVFVSGRMTPVRLDRTGHGTVGGDSVAYTASLSHADFGTHAAHIDKEGRITSPGRRSTTG